MANQPPSFRLPFTLPEDVHPAVTNALRLLFNGNTDLQQAIAALSPKVDANISAIKALSSVVAVPAPSPLLNFGMVNLQTGTAYTVQASDFGGLVVIESALAFALTLNSGLQVPFFVFIQNLGVGTATLTPSSGTVNLVPSVTVLTEQMAGAFFDGTNWWVMDSLLAQTIAKVTSNWLDSYNAATGVFTQSQPRAEDLSNGVTGTGKVVLDSTATLKFPTIDSGTLVGCTFTGITRILGLSIYANNAAAIAGGLVVGDLYRSGSDPDLVQVVH